MEAQKLENLFSLGEEYSRGDIGKKLGIKTNGGNWVTGYVSVGEKYLLIFANIGVEGNAYDNKKLKNGLFEWYGNTRSKIDQPLMKKIINNEKTCLLFIRYNKNEKFIYTGVVKCEKYFDTTPVKIHFSYTNDSKGQLSEKSKEEATKAIKEIDSIPNLETTERDVIAKQRIGQSMLRIQLLQDRECKCEIDNCGMKKIPLLIASHIKPWKDSTSEEKLSLNNVLLLCPQHDALFDKGYISFDKTGKIIISKELDDEDCEKLNIHKDMRISINDEKKKYLEFHRNSIFRDKK